MVLEILVWALMAGLFLCGLLLFQYYQFLFDSQEDFQRDELLGLRSILVEEFREFIGKDTSQLSYLSLAVGALFAWLLCLIGGILSLSTGPTPGHASGSPPNYFFQSALILLVGHLTLPALRKNAGALTQTLLSKDDHFLVSLAVSLAALNFMLWGIYHDTLFLYALANGGLSLAYAAYRLEKYRKESGHKEEFFVEDEPETPPEATPTRPEPVRSEPERKPQPRGGVLDPEDLPDY